MNLETGTFMNYHAKEPDWYPANGYHLRRAPEHLRFWLSDPDSLTARLLAASDGDFRVQVLCQGWRRVMSNETAALSCSTEESAFIRHVHLICMGRPWVFARTVIPANNLKGPMHALTKLGNKPLGAYLFSRPNLKRGPLELVRLQAGQRLHQEALNQSLMAGSENGKTAIWGRRSTFTLEGGPLLVSEFFLPNLLRGSKWQPPRKDKLIRKPVLEEA